MASRANALAASTEAAAQSASRVSRAIDRWIYAFMAGMFILVTLTGFVPDALGNIAAIRAHQRPPYPLVLHVHAFLMASFLVLLLVQTTLMANRRADQHQRLGRAALLLVPAIVLIGFILVPTTYHSFWRAAQAAEGANRAQLFQALHLLDDIMLLQLRIGLLFPLFIGIGLFARRTNPALHKRMMILATAVPLAAAIDRMQWLPTTFPTRPISTDLYILALVSPMFVWDVYRHRSVPRAYAIWIIICALASMPVYVLWESPWWHAAVPQLMRV